MALPKISYPIVEIEINQEKKYKFRPLLVKDEKLLLMAKSSDNKNDIFNTILQIINNCSLNEDLNVKKLSLFEIEYIFLKLRGFSIGNEIEVSYYDGEDNQKYDFKINLEDVKIKYPEKIVSNIIEINDGIGLTLKYPSADIYLDDKISEIEDNEIIEYLIMKCIDKIFDKDNVYDIKLENTEEVKEFIESIDIITYNKIQEFFSTVPKMEYIIEYKNSLGNNRSIVLKNLTDFFTF